MTTQRTTREEDYDDDTIFQFDESDSWNTRSLTTITNEMSTNQEVFTLTDRECRLLERLRLQQMHYRALNVTPYNPMYRSTSI